jgi:GNAT superfamily N-acetyltransferase
VTPADSPGYEWADDATSVDWDELSELYRIAPLGVKPPDALRTVFDNSMFTSFVRADGALVGVGRALADGLDCAYIADVAVHPDHQGRGLGRDIVRRLVDRAGGHRKIILYANPGTEAFYAALGFLPMNTAMAVWHDPAAGLASGVLRAEP